MTQPQATVDFNEYRQHMAKVLGEKELVIAEAALQLSQQAKRIAELERQLIAETEPELDTSLLPGEPSAD